jgi:chromosome segregation ATPase
MSRRLTKAQRDEWRTKHDILLGHAKNDLLDDLDQADREIAQLRSWQGCHRAHRDQAYKERDELRAKLAEKDACLQDQVKETFILADQLSRLEAKLAECGQETRIERASREHAQAKLAALQDEYNRETSWLVEQRTSLEAKLAEAEVRRDAFDEGWKREMELRGENLLTIDELRAKLAVARECIEDVRNAYGCVGHYSMTKQALEEYDAAMYKLEAAAVAWLREGDFIGYSHITPEGDGVVRVGLKFASKEEAYRSNYDRIFGKKTKE